MMLAWCDLERQIAFIRGMLDPANRIPRHVFALFQNLLVENQEENEECQRLFDTINAHLPEGGVTAETLGDTSMFAGGGAAPKAAVATGGAKPSVVGHL